MLKEAESRSKAAKPPSVTNLNNDYKNTIDPHHLRMLATLKEIHQTDSFRESNTLKFIRLVEYYTKKKKIKRKTVMN